MKKLKNLEPLKLNKLKIIFFTTCIVLFCAFVALLLFNDKIVESMILTTTTICLAALGITRLLVVIKADKKQIKVIANILEALVNITIAIVILLIIPNPDASALIVGLYCYLISVALFGRGIVFLIEGVYCNEEKNVFNFILHIALIVSATVFIAREMTLVEITNIIIALVTLVGIFCIVELFLSIRKYRRLSKEKKQSDLKESIKKEVQEEILKEQEQEVEESNEEIEE